LTGHTVKKPQYMWFYIIFESAPISLEGTFGKGKKL